MKKQKKLNNKGFSMVELVIVIAIMAVLIAVLAPQYIKYVESSRVSTDDTNAGEILKAVQVLVADGTISTGCTVTWSGTTVTSDVDAVETAVNTALSSDVQAIKSKLYTGKSYVVTVAYDDENNVSVIGEWDS